MGRGTRESLSKHQGYPNKGTSRSMPDPGKTYFLQTDASDSGIGAVLMQKHDGKLFPVCYARKKFSSAERNYSTIEKECLAIVWGFKRFHLYLYGVSFVLQTDHEPLKYMNSAKFANGHLMRWAMFLQLQLQS